MKFPEPKTLRGAISPVILTSWIFGMGVVEYPAGQPRPLMSVCWSIAHLFLFLSLIIPQNWRDISWEDSAVSMVAYSIIIAFGSITVIVFFTLGHTKSKDLAASLRMFDTVNNIFSEYGVSKDYGPTFKSQIIELIVAFICISITVSFGIFSTDVQYGSEIGQLSFLATVTYLLVYSFVVENTLTNLIRYVHNRFQRLNEYLMHISFEENNIKPFLRGLQLDDSLWPTTFEIHANSSSSRVCDRQWMVHLIWNSRKIHRELYKIAKAVNEAFDIQILLSMTMSCCFIIHGLWNNYNFALTLAITSANYKISFLLGNVSSVVINIAKVFNLISVCAMTSTQAQRTGELIHRLVNPTTDWAVKNEIRIFSLQLLQGPLQFTAREFFTLDFTMFSGMAGMVATYFVIMIQMQSVDEPKAGSTEAITHAINSTY